MPTFSPKNKKEIRVSNKGKVCKIADTDVKAECIKAKNIKITAMASPAVRNNTAGIKKLLWNTASCLRFTMPQNNPQQPKPKINITWPVGNISQAHFKARSAKVNDAIDSVI